MQRVRRLLQFLRVGGGHGGGVVPGITQDQLPHAGGNRAVRPDSAELGGRHIRQALRSQHILVAIHHGGIQARRRRRDRPHGACRPGLQLFELGLEFPDLTGEVLVFRISIVPLQHQRPELAAAGLRLGQPVRRQTPAVFQNILHDLGIQLHGYLGAARRVLGILELLDAGLQGADLRLPVQGRLIGVNGCHNAAVADAFTLLPPKAQQTAAVVRKHLLLPHHIAGQVDAVFHLVVVGQRCGQGVRKITVALHPKIGQYRQRYGGHQQLHSQRVVLHGDPSLCNAPAGAKARGLRRFFRQVHRPHRRDGGNRMLIYDLLLAAPHDASHRAGTPHGTQIARHSPAISRFCSAKRLAPLCGGSLTLAEGKLIHPA